MWLKVMFVLPAFYILLCPAALQSVLCPPQETCIYTLFFFITLLCSKSLLGQTRFSNTHVQCRLQQQVKNTHSVDFGSLWCCSLERIGIENDKLGKFDGEGSVSVYNLWGQVLAASSSVVTLADVVAPAVPCRESHERSSALK